MHCLIFDSKFNLSMCYYKKVNTNQLTALMKGEGDYVKSVNGMFNGFEHPNVAVLINKNPMMLQTAGWGLIPNWASHDFNRTNTLNARIETLEEKPSFQPYLQQRCIIPISSFFEWQWLDPKGKQKQKFEIEQKGQLTFLAGLWTERNGIFTYTVVTTAANELMATIHNIKKRMPLILTQENKENWLQGDAIKDFQHCDVVLNANPIYEKPIQMSLF